LGYLDFLALMKHAKVVLTDSGGLQEETTALGIPCITIRENTERPITVEQGTNTVVGNSTENIVKEWKNIVNTGGKKGRIPEMWDGKTAERTGKAIVEYFDN
jgi:UDP-N-acetylglucosamine 2-epimerase (non-hydrolysing)